MRKSLYFNSLTLLFAVGFAGDAQAQLQATPAEIQFEAITDSAAVRLYDNGEPLPAAAVQGIRVMIFEHNYSHQFRVERVGGDQAVIEIRPDPRLVEVGSFDLVVDTSQGQVKIPIHTPLTQSGAGLEARAAAQGVTVEALKRELGLIKEGLPSHISIDMPDTIYLGHVLEFDLEGHETHRYVWRVDGQEAQSGPGAHDFVIAFSSPGEHMLEFEDYVGDTLVASWRDTFGVNFEPPITQEVDSGTNVSLQGPSGYATCNWFLEGAPVAGGAAFNTRIERPGTYTVRCRAENPETSEGFVFRIVTYELIVQ